LTKSQKQDGPRRNSFIVRVEQDDTGNVRGVIERVGTGEKEPFRHLDAIGDLIARMVVVERETPPDAASRN
jgi:hypothetical protein